MKQSVGVILSDYAKGQLLGAHLEIIQKLAEVCPYPMATPIVIQQGVAPYELPGAITCYLPDSGFRLGPLVALIKGLRVAQDMGLTAVCFRPGDDWVLNHQRVAENFARAVDGAIFQGFNWFTRDTHEDFSLTDCYLDVSAFGRHVEEFSYYTAMEDRHAACEHKLASWVRRADPGFVRFHRLAGRERVPSISWVREEVDLGLGRMGLTRPANYNDRDNNRFFNKEWQLIGDHDDRERRENYSYVRGDVPYVDWLEKQPFFRSWLEGRAWP